MRYIVVSTAVTDEIRFADGTCMKNVAGGAGIYALAGIKIWSDDVGIVTGVGKDYLDIYSKWYSDNGIPTLGLKQKAEKTPHNIIQYYPDGERTENPLFGPEHYRSMETTPEELSEYCRDAKGIYIFKNTSQPFWEKIQEIKRMYCFKLMWEIAADATMPENLKAVKDIATHVDIFSINKTEAKNMLSKESMGEVIEELKKWGIPLVYLRQGKKGAFMISSDSVCEIPSVPDTKVIDVTGGGNSSSGAVLYGFCEGFDLLRTGIMGSISASCCISQYGVPEIIDEKYREQALELREKLIKETAGRNM